jgi:hypothetical protein
LAIDINVRGNEKGNVSFSNGPGFVRAFTDAGFYWGGWFTGTDSDGAPRIDPHHFSSGF